MIPITLSPGIWAYPPRKSRERTGAKQNIRKWITVMSDDATIPIIIAEGGLPSPTLAPPRFIPAMEDTKREAASGSFDILASVNPLAPRIAVPDPRVSPWNAVTLLGFFVGQQQIAHATGFMIKPDVVLTAAHNLEIAFERIGVYRAYDSALNPVASLTVRARARHSQRDVAVLIVDPAQGSVMTTGDNAPASAILAGYSIADANGRPRMTTGTATYTKVQSIGRYAIDARRGDSGSPVFVNTNGGGRAVAVHSALRDVGSGIGLTGIGESIDPGLATIINQLEAAARQRITGG